MGAVPSLEASSQAQIEDLVQRNRTLEHVNKKLSEQVEQEKQRHNDNMTTVQAAWEEKQRSWQKLYEGILTSCRIAQKRLVVELEASRSAVIKEMAVTREEKLQRLQRDFKIKLFQMKEEELERRIEDLEDEKAKAVEETEAELQRQLEKCEVHTAKLKEAREALARSLRENEKKEEKYNKLVAERSNMEAKNGTLESQLTRVQLQLEGSHTKMKELERTNDDLRRTIADQTRQIERWQNLETKGGEEAEKHHKEKVELEFRVRELEEALEEQRKETEAEKRRTQKVKDVMENWQVEAKQKDKELKDANKQLAKLQKSLDKLKDDLEVERARVRPPSPQKPRAPSPPSPPSNNDDGIEEGEEPEPPPRRERKTSAKPEAPIITIKSPVLNGLNGSATTSKRAQIARKTTGGRPPRPKRPPTPIDVDAEESSEAEEEDEPPAPAPTKKQKGKAKATDTEVEQEPEDPPKRTRKRKATTDNEQSGEDEVQIVEKPKSRRKGSRAPSEVPESKAGKTRTKPPSRAASKQPSVKPPSRDKARDEEEEGQGPAPPKKKKKLNVPAPFAFDSLAGFGDTNALNIPSVLSPVKDDEHVPQRSLGSSLLSKFSFTSALRKG
ncbi:hypothetical protein CVT26_001437 [Gymnopilus dilepis]|uniref:Uncharacterized protein n=1 Tax=Gymnopilus dilepis TaxID=231916 RepID=A0A409WVZ1_9AGAR|nr:hypothetical protein CVT26_001437 [Gymnopilus dilepis]